MRTAAFRADASIEIGTGHVMRSLTLADALRECGFVCRFLSRDLPAALAERIRRQGHACLFLPASGSAASAAVASQASPAHAAWLRADWREDAQQSLAALGPARLDWLVVDHYALDARWEQRLRPACANLMVIDDLADRAHACDLLLDQNLGRRPADYRPLVPPDCEIVAGPSYALLRPEFAEARPLSLGRRRQPTLGQVLVSLGGVDKDNVSGQVLAALESSLLPSACRLKVVLGPGAPWLDSVRRQAAGMHRSTEVLSDVQDMAALMAESDLAVGAAGSTSWERCALGLPALLTVLAGNQRGIARALEQCGAARTFEMGRLRVALDALLAAGNLQQVLSLMSAAAAQVTDGAGTGRVASFMCERSAV
jgi:UDP-2,4-diacetamido-2,4,6-trideoxy-beta-L-altropyranose hydrolase